MRRLAALAGLAIAVAVVATAIAAPLTGNVAVNESTAETQQAPRVALQPGGGFLVAWEERDLGNGVVFARRFGADGAPLSRAGPVVSSASPRQEAPDIDTAPDGSAVVTWTEGGTGDRDVRAQRLTAAGSPTGPAIAVIDGSGTQEFSRVAVSPDGTFTIVWADPAAASGGQEDIYMSRFEADGDLIDDDLAVVARADYQLDPDVAALPDGTLVVAFADRALGEVRARRFDADGVLLGSEISVGADALGFFGPGRPSVDADATGFTVAFELDDTTFVRRFGTERRAGDRRRDGRRVPVRQPVRRHRAGRPLRRGLDRPGRRRGGAEGVLRRARPETAAPRTSARPATRASRSRAAWPRTPPGSSSSGRPTTPTTAACTRGGSRGAAAPRPRPRRRPRRRARRPPPSPAPVATATPDPARRRPRRSTLADVVRGLPSTRRCVSRRNFRIRLREPKGTKFRRATVKVNGKLVATRKGKRVTAPVDLRGLPKGRYKVEIRITTSTGRVIKGTRRYRTCVAKKKK